MREPFGNLRAIGRVIADRKLVGVKTPEPDQRTYARVVIGIARQIERLADFDKTNIGRRDFRAFSIRKRRIDFA